MTDISHLPTLKKGYKGIFVKQLQAHLRALGYFNGAPLGNFLEQTEKAVKDFQQDYNLKIDGVFGPITKAAMLNLGEEIVLPPILVDDKYFGAPWMKFMFDRLGWTEFSHTRELSEGWKYVGLSKFKTVIGSTYAWCAMIVQSAMRSVGLKGSGSAAAKSYKDWAYKASDWWFGSAIHMKHASGGNHVGFFICWYDKAKTKAVICGGNQSNALNLTIFDFNKEIESTPRWPHAQGGGQVVSLAQFQKVWPNIKIRGASGSTR